MIKGVYTSMSGLAAAQARQQVLAHNIANTNTPGYKADDVTAESFEKIFNEINPTNPGTGAVSAGRRYDLSQGGLTETGAPLDLALDGKGFFVLDGPDGPLYTRAGRFTRDNTGGLRSPDGLAVQGENGAPLNARGADVRVLADGTVTSDGAVAGRLRVVSFEQEALIRAGTTTFTANAAPVASEARVISGALQGSNVDPTAVMTMMTMLTRAFEAGRQAVQLQNETLNAAVNQVGSLR